MFPSDSLPSELRFRQAYTLSLYLSVMGRVSPVPNHTFYTYRFLYTERFLRAASSFFTRSMVFTYMRKAQLLFALFSETFLTIRQNSLNVTVCIIACPSCRGYFIHSLSTLYYYNAPSLATRLTGDYRDRTYTGKCGPASLDTPQMKRTYQNLFQVSVRPFYLCSAYFCNPAGGYIRWGSHFTSDIYLRTVFLFHTQKCAL